MQCDIRCSDGPAAALNQRCTCVVTDIGRVRDTLTRSLPGVAEADAGRHASLFSPYALFVDRAALEAMGAVAAAVFEVARHPAYVGRVLGYAPEIARHDPGSTGRVLGLDFHLTVSGPRLIEINTNPGGLLLSALLLDAVRPCAPAAWTPCRVTGLRCSTRRQRFDARRPGGHPVQDWHSIQPAYLAKSPKFVLPDAPLPSGRFIPWRCLTMQARGASAAPRPRAGARSSGDLRGRRWCAPRARRGGTHAPKDRAGLVPGRAGARPRARPGRPASTRRA